MSQPSPTPPGPERPQPVSRPARSAGKSAAAPPVNPLMYHLVVAATRLPGLLRGQHVHAHGRELIPPGGRLIVAGKHVTALDPFLIAQSLPRGRYIQFMTKKELFKGVVGRIIAGGGSFPVDRSVNDLGAIRSALRVLQAGGTLGIFPEGTRGGGDLQGGAALLALKGKAPVTPVGLRLSGRTWVVRFGPPIAPSGGVAELTRRIAGELERLSQPF